MKKIIIFILFLVLFSPAVRAAEGALDLLKENLGPGLTAMGGAGTALSLNPYAAGWNPAGIGNLQGITLASGYTSYFGEVSNYGILGVFPTLGGCLAVTGILEKTADAPMTIYGPDGRPQVTGYFSDTQTLLALTYARPVLFKGLLAGASLKYHNHSISTASGSGFGLDAGLIYFPLVSDKGPGPLGLGLNLRNPLKTAIKWNSGASDNFSREIVAGVAYQTRIFDKNIILAADFLYGSSLKFSAGLEFWPADILPLRLGINKDGRLTLGTGLKFSRLSMDLAYLNHNDLGATYQMALAWNFQLLLDVVSCLT